METQKGRRKEDILCSCGSGTCSVVSIESNEIDLLRELVRLLGSTSDESFSISRIIGLLLGAVLPRRSSL